jgi:hypothetical protein
MERALGIVSLRTGLKLAASFVTPPVSLDPHPLLYGRLYSAGVFDFDLLTSLTKDEFVSVLSHCHLDQPTPNALAVPLRLPTFTSPLLSDAVLTETLDAFLGALHPSLASPPGLAHDIFRGKATTPSDLAGFSATVLDLLCDHVPGVTVLQRTVLLHRIGVCRKVLEWTALSPPGSA